MIQSQAASKFQKQMVKMKGFLQSECQFPEETEEPKRKTQTPLIGQSQISSLELSDQEFTSNSFKQKQIGVKSRNFNDEYEMGKKLGEGTNGIVRLCWKKDDLSEKYAVKIIQTPDEEIMNMVRMTFLNTTLLKSAYIAKSHKLYIDSHQIYMVMEYVPYDNLEIFLKDKKTLKEHQVQKILLGLLKALRSLHSAGICHRDIKPDNIQINQDDLSIKLVDFGVSRRYVSYNPNTFRYNKQNMLTVTGNIHYRAPEIYGGWGYGYTQQIDIWAVGVLAYQCLTGVLPITGESIADIIDILSQKESYMEAFKRKEFLCLTPSCRDFIKRLMMWNPLKRLNASQALKHIWIPNNMTPLKQLEKKKTKDDIDASKISQNSDIINKQLINSAMILNQELQNTLIKSKQIDTIYEEEITPRTNQIQNSLELSINPTRNDFEFTDFKQKLKLFKMETSQKIHNYGRSSTMKSQILLIDTIRQTQLNDIQLNKMSQMETSIDFHTSDHKNINNNTKKGQMDLFDLNFCESQSSLTQIDEPIRFSQTDAPNKSIDADLLEQMQKFNL